MRLQLAAAKELFGDITVCLQNAWDAVRKTWRFRRALRIMRRPYYVGPNRTRPCYNAFWKPRQPNKPGKSQDPSWHYTGKVLSDSDRAAIYNRTKEQGLPPGLQFGDDFESGKIEINTTGSESSSPPADKDVAHVDPDADKTIR